MAMIVAMSVSVAHGIVVTVSMPINIAAMTVTKDRRTTQSVFDSKMVGKNILLRRSPPVAMHFSASLK